jgi:hypothetical protein
MKTSANKLAKRQVVSSMASTFDFLVTDSHDDFDKLIHEHCRSWKQADTASLAASPEQNDVIGGTEEDGLIFEIALPLERYRTPKSPMGKVRSTPTLTIDHVKDEGVEHSYTRRRKSAVEALIRYTDATGSQSERRIRIDGIFENRQGELVVSAFCMMRNAARKFFVDRMTSFIDASSGLMVKDIAGFLGQASSMARSR